MKGKVFLCKGTWVRWVVKVYEFQHYLSETDDDELSKWMMFSRDFGIFKQNVEFTLHAQSLSWIWCLCRALHPFHFTSTPFTHFFSMSIFSTFSDFPFTPLTTSYFVWINILLADVRMNRKFLESFTNKRRLLLVRGWIVGSSVVKCELKSSTNSQCFCILQRRKLKSFSCCFRRFSCFPHSIIFPALAYKISRNMKILKFNNFPLFMRDASECFCLSKVLV